MKQTQLVNDKVKNQDLAHVLKHQSGNRAVAEISSCVRAIFPVKVPRQAELLSSSSIEAGETREEIS